MQNNALMPIRENVFTRIKKFFKNLFVPEIENNYEADIINNVEEKEIKIKNSIFAENIKVEETEKQKLLRLQKMVHKKNISESDLSQEEVEKLRELYNMQIKDLRKSILLKRKEIARIQNNIKRKVHASM